MSNIPSQEPSTDMGTQMTPSEEPSPQSPLVTTEGPGSPYDPVAPPPDNYDPSFFPPEPSVDIGPPMTPAELSDALASMGGEPLPHVEVNVGPPIAPDKVQAEIDYFQEQVGYVPPDVTPSSISSLLTLAPQHNITPEELKEIDWGKATVVGTSTKPQSKGTGKTEPAATTSKGVEQIKLEALNQYIEQNRISGKDDKGEDAIFLSYNGKEYGIAKNWVTTNPNEPYRYLIDGRWDTEPPRTKNVSDTSDSMILNSLKGIADKQWGEKETPRQETVIANQTISEKELFENLQFVLYGKDWKDRLDKLYGDQIKPEFIQGKDVDYLLKHGYINEAGVSTEKGRAAGLPVVVAQHLGVTPQDMIGGRYEGLLTTVAKEVTRPSGSDSNLGTLNNALIYNKEMAALNTKGYDHEQSLHIYLQNHPWVTLKDYLDITSYNITAEQRNDILAYVRKVQATTTSRTMADILAKQGKAAESKKAQEENDAISAILATLMKWSEGTILNPKIVYADTPFIDAKLTKDDHDQLAIMWTENGNKYGIANNWVTTNPSEPYRYYVNGTWSTTITACSAGSCSLDYGALTKAKAWVDANGFTKDAETRPTVVEPIIPDPKVIEAANERIKEILKKDFEDALTTKSESDKKKLEEDFKNNPIFAALVAGVSDKKLLEVGVSQSDIDRFKPESKESKESLYVGGARYPLEYIEKLPSLQQDYLKSVGVSGLENFIAAQYGVLKPYTLFDKKGGIVQVDIVEALRSLDPAKIAAVYGLFTKEEIEEKTKGSMIYAGNMRDQYEIFTKSVRDVINNPNPDWNAIRQSKDKLDKVIRDNLQVIGERISRPVYLDNLIQEGLIPEWLKANPNQTDWWVLSKAQQDNLTDKAEYKNEGDVSKALERFGTSVATYIQLMLKNAPDFSEAGTYQFLNKDIKGALDLELAKAEKRGVFLAHPELREQLMKDAMIKDLGLLRTSYENKWKNDGIPIYERLAKDVDARIENIKNPGPGIHEATIKLWTELENITQKAREIDNDALRVLGAVGVGAGTLLALPGLLALSGADIASHASKGIFGTVSNREGEKYLSLSESANLPLGMASFFLGLPKEVGDDLAFGLPYAMVMVAGHNIAKGAIDVGKSITYWVRPDVLLPSVTSIQMTIGSSYFKKGGGSPYTAIKLMDIAQRAQIELDVKAAQATGNTIIRNTVDGNIKYKITPFQSVFPNATHHAMDYNWGEQLLAQRNNIKKGEPINTGISDPIPYIKATDRGILVSSEADYPVGGLFTSPQSAYMFGTKSKLSIIFDPREGKDISQMPREVENKQYWNQREAAYKEMAEKGQPNKLYTTTKYYLDRDGLLKAENELYSMNGTEFLSIPKDQIPKWAKYDDKSGTALSYDVAPFDNKVTGVKKGDLIPVYWYTTAEALKNGYRMPSMYTIYKAKLAAVEQLPDMIAHARTRKRATEEDIKTTSDILTTSREAFKTMESVPSVLDDFIDKNGITHIRDPREHISKVELIKGQGIAKGWDGPGVDVILSDIKNTSIYLIHSVQDNAPKNVYSFPGGSIDLSSPKFGGYGNERGLGFKQSASGQLRHEVNVDIEPSSLEQLGIFMSRRKDFSPSGARVFYKDVGDITLDPKGKLDPSLPYEPPEVDVVKKWDFTKEKVELMPAQYYQVLGWAEKHPQFKADILKNAKMFKGDTNYNVSEILKDIDKTFPNRVKDGSMLTEAQITEQATHRQIYRQMLEGMPLPNSVVNVGLRIAAPTAKFFTEEKGNISIPFGEESREISKIRESGLTEVSKMTGLTVSKDLVINDSLSLSVREAGSRLTDTIDRLNSQIESTKKEIINRESGKEPLYNVKASLEELKLEERGFEKAIGMIQRQAVRNKEIYPTSYLLEIRDRLNNDIVVDALVTPTDKTIKVHRVTVHKEGVDPITAYKAIELVLFNIAYREKKPILGYFIDNKGFSGHINSLSSSGIIKIDKRINSKGKTTAFEIKVLSDPIKLITSGLKEIEAPKISKGKVSEVKPIEEVKTESGIVVSYVELNTTKGSKSTELVDRYKSQIQATKDELVRRENGESPRYMSDSSTEQLRLNLDIFAEKVAGKGYRYEARDKVSNELIATAVVFPSKDNIKIEAVRKYKPYSGYREGKDSLTAFRAIENELLNTAYKESKIIKATFTNERLYHYMQTLEGRGLIKIEELISADKKYKTANIIVLKDPKKFFERDTQIEVKESTSQVTKGIEGKTDIQLATERWIKDADSGKFNYTPEQTADILYSNGVNFLPENITIGQISRVLKSILNGEDVLVASGAIKASYLEPYESRSILGNATPKDNILNNMLSSIKEKGGRLLTDITEKTKEQFHEEMKAVSESKFAQVLTWSPIADNMLNKAVTDILTSIIGGENVGKLKENADNILRSMSESKTLRDTENKRKVEEVLNSIKNNEKIVSLKEKASDILSKPIPGKAGRILDILAEDTIEKAIYNKILDTYSALSGVEKFGKWTLAGKEKVPDGSLRRIVEKGDKIEVWYSRPVSKEFSDYIKREWVENKIQGTEGIVTGSNMAHYYDKPTDTYYSAYMVETKGGRIEPNIEITKKAIARFNDIVKEKWKEETPREYVERVGAEKAKQVFSEQEITKIKDSDVMPLSEQAKAIFAELEIIHTELNAKNAKGEYILSEAKAAELIDTYNGLKNIYNDKIKNREPIIKEQLRLLQLVDLEKLNEAQRTFVIQWIDIFNRELKAYEELKLSKEKYLNSERYREGIPYKPKYEQDRQIPRYNVINPRYERPSIIARKEYATVYSKEEQGKPYGKYTSPYYKPTEYKAVDYQPLYTRTPPYSPPYEKVPPYIPPYTPPTMYTPPYKPVPPSLPKPIIPYPIILKQGDKEIKLTPKQAEGIVAWKQGIMYKLIYPPYGQKDIYNSPKPIKEVEYADGIKSATKSMVARYGTIPKNIHRHMGVVDINIFSQEKGSDAKPRPVFEEKYQSGGRRTHRPTRKPQRDNYTQLIRG